IPDPWVYMFRVEKRFRYGAIHSVRRKAGKIKIREQKNRVELILYGTEYFLIEVAKKYEQ
ncbi:unnamed protein product, partial [Rotaria magnacalcarata]